MERLTERRTSGINGNALRGWALLFAAIGVAGRGIIQHHVLGVGQVTTSELMELMNGSSSVMTLVTVSLILQAMETCAVPIFALLVVEGAQHTSDYKAYMMRTALMALVCEIPHNLAFGGKLLLTTSRNPVFGVFLSLIMVYFYRQYAGKELKNILIKVIVCVAAIVWSKMLEIEFGAAMVLIVTVLWVFRSRALYRNMAGAIITAVCIVFSPFFLAAPMGFLAVFFYNGEKNTTSRLLNYAAYPAMLILAAVVGVIF